ncbi:YiiX/YebB-like N1pC/P60 family cysteine hydrolase [Bradyrhizobium sp. 76]|uniref:YiiX/YebB-like N1pC/P60 family cysteine hydrolase n=1 Tax=Bradyrhizobium sp. 76 TaxID=2782680 RepID=UPI001FF9D53A|nr:hypothetical protein [Bradyrhizobium sp. 76]
MRAFSRRSFASGLLLTALGSEGVRSQIIQQSPPLPRTELFNSGDFLWPKKPGEFVPYSQQANAGPEHDAAIWQKEKQQFLEQAATESSGLSASQLAQIKDLDYREFLARYEADQRPGTPGVYSSGGGVYVGHVAIVNITSDRKPEVVEAIWGAGVVRHSYESWLAGRQGEVVWLGRLRDRSAEDRARISTEAAKYVGRPYNFWNFNLNDDSGFYCSKLAWLSVFRSLGFALDGDPNPQRGFWFSPKQMLYLPVVDRLYDPGPYAYR